MAESRYILKDNQSWIMFLDKILSLRDRHVKLDVRVRPYSKRRSTSANAFYWACVVTPLAEHTGYTTDEMHMEILGAYTGWETREFRGHKREFPRRTSTTPETMSTVDFQTLIQLGQQIAAELGVVLPDQDNVEVSGDEMLHKKR